MTALAETINLAPRADWKKRAFKGEFALGIAAAILGGPFGRGVGAVMTGHATYELLTLWSKKSEAMKSERLERLRQWVGKNGWSRVAAAFLVAGVTVVAAELFTKHALAATVAHNGLPYGMYYGPHHQLYYHGVRVLGVYPASHIPGIPVASHIQNIPGIYTAMPGSNIPVWHSFPPDAPLPSFVLHPVPISPHS